MNIYHTLKEEEKQIQKNYKISKKKEKELNKVIDSYNRKVKRVKDKYEKMGIDSDFIPDKINKRDFKKNLMNTKDVNQKINKMSRFLSRGSEDIIDNGKGVHMTKWERKEITIGLRTINRYRNRRKKEEKEKLMFYNGEELDMTKAEYNNDDFIRFKEKTFNFENMTKESFESFTETIEIQSDVNYINAGWERLRNNYINAINLELGGNGFLIKMINSMSNEELRELASDVGGGIPEIYDPRPEEDRVGALLGAIQDSIERVKDRNRKED